MSHYRVIVAVALTLAVAAVMLRATGNDGPLAEARAGLRDDADFSRVSDAGAAFARVSEHLEHAADDCGRAKPECAPLYTAAAFARVGAVRVLHCGRPELFAYRKAFRSYLARLDDDVAATPPMAPAC